MKHFFASLAAALLLMAAGTAQATYITLSTSELLLAEAVQSNTTSGGGGDFVSVDYSPTGVLFTQNMARPLTANATPYWVYSYIGVDAGAIGKSDLTGTDSFRLKLANVNNSPWELALFVQAGEQTYLSDYLLVPNQQSPVDFQQFSFDLTSLGAAISDVEYLGLAVRSKLVGDPSNPDGFHVMAAPVPEPGTVLLLGIGVLGLAIYGKRRQNA